MISIFQCSLTLGFQPFLSPWILSHPVLFNQPETIRLIAIARFLKTTGLDPSSPRNNLRATWGSIKPFQNCSGHWLMISRLVPISLTPGQIRNTCVWNTCEYSFSLTLTPLCLHQGHILNCSPFLFFIWFPNPRFPALPRFR